MKMKRKFPLLLALFALAHAGQPQTKIMITFGVANMDAVECTSCWPNRIITVFGMSATIKKHESGKDIHFRLLPEKVDDRARLTITPLERNESGEIVEQKDVIFDFNANETAIFEYKGFDLTFSIEPYGSN